MVVGTSTDDGETTLNEFVGENSSILLHLKSPLLELWLQSLTEGNGLGSDDMLQRTTLLSRENGRVEQLTHHLCHTLWSLQSPWVLEILTHKDDTSTRTTKCLVCG